MLVKPITEEEIYGIGHVTNAAILSKDLQNLRFCVIISIRKRKD